MVLVVVLADIVTAGVVVVVTVCIVNYVGVSRLAINILVLFAIFFDAIILLFLL